MSTQRRTTTHDALSNNFTIVYKRMNDFQARVILMESFDCIKIASKHGGKVFGGFVRNIIVPYVHAGYDFTREIILKDIDLWFKTNEQADAFKAEMGSRFSDSCDVSPSTSMGKFSRFSCHLVKYDVKLIEIDVIVADKLPVNDFDVNTVTYSLTEDGKWLTDSPDYLIDQILIKEANMLSSYVKKITNKEGVGCSQRNYFERINRIFISNGWTISIPSEINMLYDDNKDKVLLIHLPSSK